MKSGLCLCEYKADAPGRECPRCHSMIGHPPSVTWGEFLLLAAKKLGRDDRSTVLLAFIASMIRQLDLEDKVMPTPEESQRAMMNAGYNRRDKTTSGPEGA